MASDIELNRLAAKEWDYCPLEMDGIAVARSLEAIVRGESIPTVDENGRARSTEIKSQIMSLRETAKRVWPWMLVAGVLSVRLYGHERRDISLGE